MGKPVSISSVLSIALVAVLMLAQGVLAGDEHKMERKRIEVRGEVLDMACFISHGARGGEHAACAKKCVRGGQPMGLITDDGKVFILFGSHDDMTAYDKVKGFAGTKVVVRGKLFEKDGLKGVEVNSVESD